jgi:hypothetical protein
MEVSQQNAQSRHKHLDNQHHTNVTFSAGDR